MLRVRAALLASFVAANASSAHAISLKDALATAYRPNPQLGAARANLRATDEEVAKANAGWRPTISVSGTEGSQNLITDKPTHSENNDNQRNGTATVSEPLYRGGRTVAEIRR